MPRKNNLLGYCLPCLILIRLAVGNTPPFFQKLPDQFGSYNMDNTDISEDVAVGTIVYTLIANDNDNDPISYRVESGDQGAYFEVGISTGEVTLVHELDREVLDTLKVTFSIEDGINPKVTGEAEVTILDVNDEIPYFLGLPYTVTLPENQEPGNAIFTLTAEDKDLEDNARIYYFFDKPYEKFSLDPETGVISLTQSVDYEISQLYQLELRAQNNPNGTATSPSSLALFIVAISDVQDSPPYFTNLPYSAEIDENVDVGASVIQVAAYDGDTDINSQNKILYSLTEKNGSLFTINEVTGIISTAAPINRESAAFDSSSSLALTVQAQEDDLSQDPANVTVLTQVTIRVIDLNDETPTFETDYYNSSLLENTQKNVAVGGLLLTVTDKDLEPYNLFSLSMVGEPAIDIFEVDPSDEQLGVTTATIRVKEPSALDFELAKSFSFQVCATETQTAEVFSSCAWVEVYLQDTNDNSPTFNSTAYTAWVDENAMEGTFVASTMATDKDSGLFGELSYGLEGSGKESFHIDQNGNVTVAAGAALDLETVPVYYLTVYVTDGDGRANSAQLLVNLHDINDQAPEFQRDDYEAFVKEETTIDTPVITVLATDHDLDFANQHVTYTIVGGDPYGNFTLNSTTGDIHLAGPIDFEKISDPEGRFVLQIQAMDGGSPSLAAFTQVSIFIEGLNDNSPFFDPVEYNAAISEEPMPEEIVVTVSAFDEDRASIDIYAYQSIFDLRIQEGAVDRFAIRTNYTSGKGEIYVANPNLDRDSYGSSYDLVVIAVDRGNEPNTGTCTVHITVTDVNNKPPQFIQDSTLVVISEELVVGSTVTQLSATDTDLDSQLQFAIDSLRAYDESDQDVTDLRDFSTIFSVENLTGRVYLSSVLDREEVAKFVLELSVKDLAAPDPIQQTDTAVLEVDVEDVNDNTPQFITLNDQGFYLGEILEELTGVVKIDVGTILAIDPDLKLNGELTYQLIDGSGQDLTNYLEIDSTSGTLETVEPVDREEFDWLNLTIIVSDKGSPYPLNTTVPLYIQILDQNDNSPVFETDITYTTMVYENISVGSEVLKVKAVDADSGDKAEIRYSIVSGNSQNKFTIDPVTGEIRVVEELDRESIVSVDGTAEYALTITASDESGSPTSKQTNQQVEIVVLDVNDQSPQFSSLFYSVNLQEDDVQGKSVITLVASDNDQEGSPNSLVHYSIESGNELGLFSIDEDTGLVMVATATLQNKQGNYSLGVMARDSGLPPLDGHTTLIIYVADSNDAYPTFISMTLYDDRIVTLSQNEANIILLPEGHEGLVCQILAQDTDLGTNGEVRYLIEEALGSDFDKFSIDSTSGGLQILETTDRELFPTYSLSIRAYDQGVPQLSQDISLVVEVEDSDDNPPAFDGPLDDQGNLIAVELSVYEGMVGAMDGEVPAAVDTDLGDNAAIYYFLVCGNQEGHFSLDPVSRKLSLLQALDREEQDQYQLVVKAHPDPNYAVTNFDCEASEMAVADLTLQPVVVMVLDQNDNPPVFVKPIYLAGFAVDVAEQFEALVTQVEALDPDLGENGEVNYSLVSQLGQINGGKEKSVNSFQISALNGEIYSIEVFSPDDTGNFTLLVEASDIGGLSNTALVYIYLLTEAQRLEIHIRSDANTVVSQQDEIAAALSAALGLQCMADIVQVHLDQNNEPVASESDMFIHCVDPATGQVVEVEEIIQRMEDNTPVINTIFNTYDVISVQQAEWVETEALSSDLSVTQWSLLALFLAAILVIFILVVLSTSLRRRYRLKLKAAKSVDLKSYRENGDAGPGELYNHQPGTNIFNYEGSNPIWSVSTNSITYSSTKDEAELNSLDENQVSRRSSARSAESQEATYTVAPSDIDLSNLNTDSGRDELLILDTVLNEHSESDKDRGRAQFHPPPPPPTSMAAMNGLDHLLAQKDTLSQSSSGGGRETTNTTPSIIEGLEDLPAMDLLGQKDTLSQSSSGFGSSEIPSHSAGDVFDDLSSVESADPRKPLRAAEPNLYVDPRKALKADADLYAYPRKPHKSEPNSYADGRKPLKAEPNLYSDPRRPLKAEADLYPDPRKPQKSVPPKAEPNLYVDPKRPLKAEADLYPDPRKPHKSVPPKAEPNLYDDLDRAKHEAIRMDSLPPSLPPLGTVPEELSEAEGNVVDSAPAAPYKRDVRFDPEEYII